MVIAPQAGRSRPLAAHLWETLRGLGGCLRGTAPSIPRRFRRVRRGRAATISHDQRRRERTDRTGRMGSRHAPGRRPGPAHPGIGWPGTGPHRDRPPRPRGLRQRLRAGPPAGRAAGRVRPARAVAAGCGSARPPRGRRTRHRAEPGAGRTHRRPVRRDRSAGPALSCRDRPCGPGRPAPRHPLRARPRGAARRADGAGGRGARRPRRPGGAGDPPRPGARRGPGRPRRPAQHHRSRPRADRRPRPRRGLPLRQRQLLAMVRPRSGRGRRAPAAGDPRRGGLRRAPAAARPGLLGRDRVVRDGPSRRRRAPRAGALRAPSRARRRNRRPAPSRCRHHRREGGAGGARRQRPEIPGHRRIDAPDGVVDPAGRLPRLLQPALVRVHRHAGGLHRRRGLERDLPSGRAAGGLAALAPLAGHRRALRDRVPPAPARRGLSLGARPGDADPRSPHRGDRALVRHLHRHRRPGPGPRDPGAKPRGAGGAGGRAHGGARPRPMRA